MRQSILVVDDNYDLRSLIGELLSEEFDVSTAESLGTAQALIAASGGFDLVLLDVELPDGNGCDYCMDLRRAGIATPVILMSGYGGAKDISHGLQSGANDYLTKPFFGRELIQVIHSIVPSSHMRLAAQAV